MKAAVVQKPGTLIVGEVPLPECGEYDALCEILYGATCSGTDSHIIHGRMPFPIAYPVILGHESIGRVIKLGSQVRNFALGDLVTKPGALPSLDGSINIAWGGFAEYGIVRDRKAMAEDKVNSSDCWDFLRVNKVLPADTEPAAATMITTWRETLSCLLRLGFKAGNTLLVLGSGGNALSFVAHARNLGAGLIALVGNPTRFDTAQAAGAKQCFDYRDTDLSKSILAQCAGGFQFIIDAVGKSGMIDRVLSVLVPGGVVNVYGIDDYNDVIIHPRLAQGKFQYFPATYDEEETHEQVVDFMRRGLLDARIWLEPAQPFPLSKIAEAFREIEARKIIKAVVALKS